MMERSPGGDAFAPMFRQTADVFREQVGTEFREAFEAPYTLAYIHLKDARVFSPSGGAMPQEGFWWRGRIDKVDGFTIGSLSIAR